jgi:selenocysteine lyase/cysteine desulfurase
VHDIGQQKGGIVTFSKDGVDVTAIKAGLAAAKINVSVSGRSSTYLDMTARQLDQIIRASAHYFNTEAEIDQLCRTVAGLK